MSAAALALVACDKPAAGGGTSDALLQPDTAAMKRAAPDSFDVAFETGKGPFVVRAYRAWSPLGVDRFHYLVRNGYFDHVKFFRNIQDFMVQFGIHGDPNVNAVWNNLNIADEPVKQSNTEGMLTDGMGFAPIGKVISGMDVVMKLYDGYGEGAPRGAGPDQGRLQREGNRYLNTYFPQLDSIVTARIK
jgi:peptidyl-prolyl cis-trans isomerase A (cyclophilin A)